MEEIFIEAETRIRLIASLLELLEEPLPLVDRIIQFRKPVRDLLSRNEKLEPVTTSGSSSFRRERGEMSVG